MRIRLLLWLVAGGLAACGDDTFEPPAELIEFAPAYEIQTLWKHKVGKGTERLRLGLAPATDGARIFAGAYNGSVMAVDMDSGDVVWEADTDLKISAGPGVGGGLAVFGTSDGVVIALDTGTGEVRWQQSVRAEVIAPPAVNDDVVVFRGTDGSLTALRVDDGSEAWTRVQTLPVLTLRGTSAPLLVGDYAIAGFDNGRIGAYALANGLERWEYVIASPSGRSEIERLVDVGMDLEAFGNIIYAASFQGRAAALLVTSGEPLWPDKRLSSFTGLGVDSDHVYVTDEFSAVIALERGTGVESWRQTALRLRDVTAAARHRDTVVVADFEGYVHWLSADDGSFLARERAASAQITAQPLAVGPVVYIQSEDGTIAALQIAEDQNADESD